MYMESHIAEIDKEKAIVNVHAKEYVQTWKRTSPISILSTLTLKYHIGLALGGRRRLERLRPCMIAHQTKAILPKPVRNLERKYRET